MAGRFGKWPLMVAAGGATAALMVATRSLGPEGAGRVAAMTAGPSVAPAWGAARVDAPVEIAAEGRSGLEEDRAREAVRQAERAAPRDDRALASTMYDASLTLCERGYSDEAVALMGRALAILEAKFGTDSLLVAQALERLAEILHFGGSKAQAEAPIRRAFAIRDRLTSSPDQWMAQDLKDLVMLYHDEGRYAEAEPMARRLVAIQETLDRPAGTRLVISLYFLGRIALKLGHPAEAESALKRGLAILEANPAAESEEVAFLLRSLADVAAADGRYDEALALTTRVMQLGKSQSGPALHAFDLPGTSAPAPDPKPEPAGGRFPRVPLDLRLKQASALAPAPVFPASPP